MRWSSAGCEPRARFLRPRIAPALRSLLGVIWLAASTGCILPIVSPEWGINIEEAEWARALEGLPPDAQSSLKPLSEVFYARITSRRFNSRATFEDPSVRQFFETVASYSDYYAALADAIDRAYIENNRPYAVELLSVGRDESGALRLEVRFTGDNDRPLRWWSSSLTRKDQWQWRDARWWIIPGKV